MTPLFAWPINSIDAFASWYMPLMAPLYLTSVVGAVWFVSRRWKRRDAALKGEGEGK